jgi:hypothetical protein
VPYLWSIVAVVAAVVVLGLVVAALLGPVKRFALVAGVAREQLGREAGMITARTAALRVRLEQRRARTIDATVEGATP